MAPERDNRSGREITRESWSREEVEAVTADYVQMLSMELAGQRYNKTDHRRALLPRLNSRSDGSVERKHQNISAILIDLGVPWILGYKPLSNYQELLYEVVAKHVATNRELDDAATDAVDRPAVTPTVVSYGDFVVDAPGGI